MHRALYLTYTNKPGRRELDYQQMKLLPVAKIENCRLEPALTCILNVI